MLAKAILKTGSHRLIQFSIAGFAGWDMLNMNNLTAINRLSFDMMKEGRGIHYASLSYPIP